MHEDQIQAYGRARNFRAPIVDRWLGLGDDDKKALLELAARLKVGENHFRDILDWLEEVSMRDGVAISRLLETENLSRPLSDPRLGRSDKLKGFKEELRRLRFPRLARIEAEIDRRIRALNLGPQIQMAAPVGLEGGTLTVQMKVKSCEDLRRSVAALERSLRREGLQEVFALLSGEATDA